MVAAGSGTANLFNPLYTVKLSTNTLGELRVFTIDMQELTGTDSNSWGSIKNIFVE